MTWEELEEEIQILASKIITAPDIVVGIVRGGIIPARLLSNKLQVKEMYCFTVKKNGTEREVTNTILEDLSGKIILLVEDILETGKSLLAAKLYLQQKGAIVETACLYTMPNSEIKPDYSLKEIKAVISFPWD